MTPETTSAAVPSMFWVHRSGRITAAPAGHFDGALEIMRAAGNGDEADALEADYFEESEDDGDFSIRRAAYDAAESIGWFRGVRDPSGIMIEPPGVGDRWMSWLEIPRRVRMRLEDAAFHHRCPVFLDNREVIERPTAPSAV